MLESKCGSCSLVGCDDGGNIGDIKPLILQNLQNKLGQRQGWRQGRAKGL